MPRAQCRALAPELGFQGSLGDICGPSLGSGPPTQGRDKCHTRPLDNVPALGFPRTLAQKIPGGTPEDSLMESNLLGVRGELPEPAAVTALGFRLLDSQGVT